MGEGKLASFFLKVQAVEESFLLLAVKERSRALNILQSSVNKLLNFVGDDNSCSGNSCAPDTSLSNQENDPNGDSRSKNLRKPAVHGKKSQRNRSKNKTANRIESGTYCDKEETERKLSPENFFNTDVANNQQNTDTSLQQQSENAKHENKSNFDDDLQELADFDCSTYDFNPTMQQHTNDNAVSRAGTSHMTQCSGKLAGKMLSMSVATSEGNICPTSVTQSQYQDQMIEVSSSHQEDGCVMSHSHYGDQILTGSQDMKRNCHLAHAAQFGTNQIMSASQIDSGAEVSQYTRSAIDSRGDPSQYAGGVIDSTGGPSQFAGGVIDSSGDPSQYAGGVIDTSGERSQYAGAVIDSAGDSSQYGGGVIDMTVGQDVQNCNPSHGHAQYTGAMIPTAQDVTVCTTSQYAGTVLAMSVPETVSYSAAHYSHTIMQGVNCAVTTHPEFTADTVLDMSTAAARNCVDTSSGLPSSQPLSLPPSSQYAGTIFEGTVVGTPVSTCSPFQLRRAPVFEPYEAFHRSQEFTQSLVHASMLQQQQLYQQLHHQVAVVSSSARRRAFVCRDCGETLTHHRSVKAHLATHGSSPLSCRFCQQRQVNHIAFLHHLCGGQHWKQSAYVSREIHMCHECGKFFTSRLSLKGHYEEEHGVDMPQEVKFTCRFCGLHLSKKLALFLHYRQHACGRFVCLQCGAILNDFVQYANHMAQHERRKRKRTCQQCGQLFLCHRNFVEHIKTHAGHTCETCQKRCSSFAALSKHRAKAHRVMVKVEVTSSKTQDEHECDECSRQFPQAKDLEQHRTYLHTSEKPLHCDVCNMSVRTPKALIKHQQTIGHCRRSGKSQENQHLCSQCGKAYFRRQALQRHLRQHQNTKSFSCQYCNFTCSERDNLRRHSARHFSTQRNFICELCGAAFHAKKTLEMHHSYKHNSERRFKCPDCPMTFKARNALGRHFKTHSRAREHGCWCGAAFNRLYNLRRHMRLVHGSDDALPPLRKVEVLDSNQAVKQALSTPPAKKMLVKTRKVKADCMQKEQEAAAAAVVIGGEEAEETGGRDGHDCGDGRGREGVQTLLPPQVGMAVLASQDGLENVSNVDGYSSMAAVGVGVVGQANVLHPISHHVHAPSHHHPHPHLTMEQSYAMVSATLHHHHHNLHHNLHHHDPQQQTLIATASTAATTDHSNSTTTTPFPTPHPAIDYSHIPSLSAMVPYPANFIPSSTTNITNNNAAANGTSVAADASNQQRQDCYPPPPAGATSIVEGMQQQTAEYTASPFSFIQNFLLPSVGMANLLDLAHASGSK